MGWLGWRLPPLAVLLTMDVLFGVHCIVPMKSEQICQPGTGNLKDFGFKDLDEKPSDFGDDEFEGRINYIVNVATF